VGRIAWLTIWTFDEREEKDKLVGSDGRSQMIEVEFGLIYLKV